MVSTVAVMIYFLVSLPLSGLRLLPFSSGLPLLCCLVASPLSWRLSVPLSLFCFGFLSCLSSGLTVGTVNSFCRFPPPYTFAISLHVCVCVFSLYDLLSFHVDPRRFSAALFRSFVLCNVSILFAFRSRPCFQRLCFAFVLFLCDSQRLRFALRVCCVRFSLLSD